MKKRLTEMEEKALQDKLFITEVINDLYRGGRAGGWKADEMLVDWARELKNKCRTIFPASRLKKVHAETCGANNW